MSNLAPNEPGRAVVMIALLAATLAMPLTGQRGTSDSARMAQVRSAVQRAGYSGAAVLGHGSGGADGLFVLTARRGDSGVVIATWEPDRTGAHPIVLERARVAADLGVRSVQVTPFLGTRDLFDVEVNHQPFQLETSHTYATHHLLRRQADVLSGVCDLDGSSSSSYSKGNGSTSTTRTMTIARVPGPAIAFSVRVSAKTVQRRAREAPPTTDSSETVRWYELPVAGTCREVRAPRP